MSLIVACITRNNKIIIKADGRTLDLEDNVIDEHAKKIFQLSDNLAIAFAGYNDTKKFFVDYLAQEYPDPSSWNINNIYDSFLECGRKNFNILKPLEVIIAGYMNKKAVLKYIISADSCVGIEEPIFNFFVIGCHEYKFSYEYDIHEGILSDRMNKFIKEVSTFEYSVNDIVDSVVLYP